MSRTRSSVLVLSTMVLLSAGWVQAQTDAKKPPVVYVPYRDLAELVVQLSAPAQGPQLVHIQASAKKDTTTACDCPMIGLLGADFQRGYLVVDTGDQLRIRGRKVSDARQIEPQRDAALLRAFGGLAGEWFNHWGDASSVRLDLARLDLRRTSDDHQTIVVDTEQVLLSGEFRVAAVGQPMFDCSFALPLGWDVTVGGKREGFRYSVSEAIPRLLRVDLDSPVRPEGEAVVGIVMRRVPKDWKWDAARQDDAGAAVRSAMNLAPEDEKLIKSIQQEMADQADSRVFATQIIRPQADTISGVVSIVSSDRLEVTKVFADPVGDKPTLAPVNVGRMAGLGVHPLARFAFSYTAEPLDLLAMNASRPQVRLLGESIGLVSLSPTAVTGDWLVAYAVTGRPIDKLHLLLDGSLGEAVRIEAARPRPAGSPGQDVPVAIVSRAIIAAPHGQAVPRGYNLFELTLDAPVAGPVRLTVHYDRPASSGSVVLPLVRPFGAEQTGELLAVQAGEDLAVAASAEGAAEIDALELPPNLPLPAKVNRLLSVWRLPDRDEKMEYADGGESAYTWQQNVPTSRR
jgi:hypothetical protein